LEREKIPTTQISLIREHTEGMRPPRALYVPFELGRPFGHPNAPDLQQKVLLTALTLLERTDGPLIEDFEPLSIDLKKDNQDIEGWVCPINLAIPQNSLNDIQKLAIDLKQEVALLQPWYRESIKFFKGRRLDGLTNYSPLEIIDLLVSFIKNPEIESYLPNQPIGRALKLTSDDLKYFYFQSAMARPTNISDNQLENWFYGETLAGKLLIKIRSICLEHKSKALQLIGRTNFVPNAMLKYV
jgi:hypothetical protein